MEQNYTIVMQNAMEDIHEILGFPLYRFRDFSEAIDLLEYETPAAVFATSFSVCA